MVDDVQRRQDALVLNLLRACETAIDLAMHVVRKASLGVPQSSRVAFASLAQDGRIAPDLAEELQRTAGCRTIAVQRYQELDLDVMDATVRQELDVFERLVRTVLQRPEP